jgi:hypothetical protein
MRHERDRHVKWTNGWLADKLLWWSPGTIIIHRKVGEQEPEKLEEKEEKEPISVVCI